MFLVKDERPEAINLVFTWEDPRTAGYQGNVVDGVSLDYDMEAVHAWRDGEATPDACVGRDSGNVKHYKVFKHCAERQSANFEAVPGSPAVFGSWKDYLKVRHAEDLSEQDWFEQLDRYDEASRLRRQRTQSPVPPVGKNRDEVAAWVAKKHLIADSTVREVWYLPHEAPPGEIRLIEVNDRLTGSESEVQAIDFGLNVEGTNFRLIVADASSSQLNQIKKDPSYLPTGWSLQGNRIWKRGA